MHEHRLKSGEPSFAISGPVHEAYTALDAHLITMAANLDPANQSFARWPDDPAEHAPKWHQHGVVTHSREFSAALRSDVPGHVREWGLAQPVETALAEEIDGVPRGELLQLTGLVHDLGKFSTRRLSLNKDRTLEPIFVDHEAHSGRIIRDTLSSGLKVAGLSEVQIEYLARTAELHFELGKVRRASAQTGGYNLAFADSPAFEAAVSEILGTKNSAYALEIGLLFVADCFSKCDVRPTADTDTALAAQKPQVAYELAVRGLNPELINQAMQLPINLKVANRYLQMWAGRQAA